MNNHPEQNIRGWGARDVALWLQEVGFSDCCQDFRTNHVDGNMLLSMTTSQLQAYSCLFDANRRDGLKEAIARLPGSALGKDPQRSSHNETRRRHHSSRHEDSTSPPPSLPEQPKPTANEECMEETIHNSVSMAASSALHFLEHYYQALVAFLPLQDEKFIAELHGQNLLPTHVSTSIVSLVTRKEKASYFLDVVIKTDLRNNDRTSFDKLAAVMAISKYDNLPHLAAMMMTSSNIKHISMKNPENTNVLERLRNGDNSVKLDDIQSCEEAKNSRPQLKHLYNLVSPCNAASWRKIGHYLGFEHELLDIIDHDYQHRAEDCCNALLEEWLDVDTTATWNKVIKAIESPAVLLSTVTNQLRQYYINDKSAGSSDDLLYHQLDNVTTVALIHHKHRSATNREVIAVANVMHKGKVTVKQHHNDSKQSTNYQEYLVGCQTNKDLSELFSSLEISKENVPTRILIEGAPGIGKTILSNQIAFQWATFKLLVEKKLLFLIILRDPNVQEIKTLEQFVSYAIKASDINNTVKSVAQHLEDTSGKHCTIVFDGYDELSEEKKVDSYVVKIIKHDVLKLCSIVITSRHSASANLHGDVDCRVEILGFTKEKRDEFINRCLADDKDKIQKMKDYLIANPFIDGLCYIPLNMTILIYLMLESDTADLPKNQTEINDQFTVAAISRYLKKEHNVEYATRNLQSLPKEFKDQFDYLCKLAYIFLGKDKIVFNDQEIETHCPKFYGKWSTLGLLKVVKYKGGFLKGTSVASYNFLHFSIQEFLAAYYIHSLNDKKEIKILKSNFWNPRYLNASVMYVGLTKGNGFALQHFLSGHKFPILTKLFRSKCIAPNTTSNKVKCLHLLQCFSEAGNDELIQQLGSLSDNKTIDLSGYALLAKDIQTLSFFLTRSTTKTWEVLNLSKCYMGDNTFDVFCKMLPDFNENKVVILSVDLSYNHLTQSSFEGIFDLVYCFNVKHLIIQENNMHKDAFEDSLLAISIKRKVAVVLQADDHDHYYINHTFGEESLDIQTRCNYHLWNTDFILQLTDSTFVSMVTSINSLSICDKFVLDDTTTTIAQYFGELDKILKVDYALHSHNRFYAFNTSMFKTMHAFNEFIAYHKFVQADENSAKEQWKIVSLYNCITDDNPIINAFKYCFDQECNFYIDSLTISQCQVVTTDTIIEILKYCVIKNLIIMGNSGISQSRLCNAISNEVFGNYQLLNFKFGVPLLILNDYFWTDKETSLHWYVRKYLVNCKLDDSLEITNSYFCEDSSFTYELTISNCGFREDDIESIVLLNENTFMCIRIYEGKIQDEVGLNVLRHFQEFNKDESECILISDSQLIGYGVTELQINEMLESSKNINSIYLLNCSLTELAMFKSIPEYWDTIDISGSCIGDEGIEKLCMHFSCFTDRVIWIKHFNVSCNGLTPSSLIKLLQFCVVANLIVSHNNIIMVDDQKISFNAMLQNTHHILEIEYLNFLQHIPLVVTDLTKIYIYLTATPVDLAAIQESSCKGWQQCSIFHVHYHCNNNVEIKHCLTLDYSYLVLHFNIVKVGGNYELIKVVISVILNGLLVSGHKIRTIDLCNCRIDDSVCSVLCKSIFNDKCLLNYVEELDLSSNLTTEYCIGSIIKSLQYCIIRKLKVSLTPSTFLNEFVGSIFTACSGQPGIRNSISGVPFSLINLTLPNNHYDSEAEEDEESLFYNVIGDQIWQESYIFTFFINYTYGDSDISLHRVLKDLETDLQFAKLHHIHVYNSFKKAEHFLQKILAILLLKRVDDVMIYEVNLPDKVVKEIVNSLNWLGDRIHFVLTSKTMIYAYNASGHHILAAIKQSSNLNSTQPALIEQPVYTNITNTSTSLSIASYHWQYIHLNNCNITDEDLYELQACFSNVTIGFLNLSCNKLTLRAVIMFVLNCKDVQNLHINLEFNLCEILSSFNPNLFKRDLQIEIRFKGSVAFILCGSYLCKSHSYIDEFLATAMASSEEIHFLMFNCRFHVQDLDVIPYKFSLVQNLSSIYLHNVSLQARHLLSAIETLLNVNLFIAEKDFLFTNNFDNHERYFFSEGSARLEVTWHRHNKFIFKEMPLAIEMTSVLKDTKSLNISNVDVNDDLAKNIVTLVTVGTLSILILENLKLSDQQIMLILKSLECSTSLTWLEISYINAVQHCRYELFAVVVKKRNLYFLIVEKHLVFTNHSIDTDYEHGKLMSTQKGVRFEIHQANFTVFITRELFAIKDTIKMKNILKEINAFTSCSISNAYVTDDKANDIATLLSTDSDTLPKINITNLNLSGKQLMIILKSLQYATSLTHFVINSINVVNYCQDALSSIIAENETLSHLEISNCNLKEATIIKIAEAMFIVSKSIRYLILSYNRISDAAAAKLATTLRKMNSLIHLDLANTNLQTEGIISIAQSLRQTTSLETFCISNCNIPNQAVVYIVRNILMHSLSCLEMSNCKLEETSIYDITTGLIYTSSLNTIDLSMNKITDMTTANLARIINKNQNIKCLKLSMSGLNERSVIEVLSSCKVLKQLVQVDLNFAHLSAPVSENGPHMYFSIDDIIQQIVIIEEEDPYNSIMEEINKQLTHFTLSNCSHKEMFSALAALSSLEHLDVNSSTIPFAAISSTIENNTSLKHINISNCSLCEHMFHIIAKAMSTLTQLGYLNISGIRVTKKAAGFVAATIAKNLAIYHFDVSKCQLQPNGLMKIVKSLMHLKNLSYLDISYSYFTAEAANELAYTFTQGVELEHLCLSNCNLYEQSFLAIVKSLASMTALRHLNLSNNIINSQTAFALSDCIANNSNIEYLDLSNCSLSENELRKVTASLKLLSSLKHLNFSSSVLNVHVVDDLAFAIGNNTGLEYINFSNCQVQKNGIFKILQKMLQTHTLKYINFQSNIIDTGQVDKKKSKNVITVLVRIIVNNKSLEYVNFSSCGLSALDVTSIMKAQSVLSNLVYINISNNDVDTEAADEISSVIKSNKSLEVVDFSRCDMGVGSMSTVSNALSQCMHLRIVNLSNNVITREATKVLALSLCNIATLEHLDLSCCSLECSQFFATLSTSSSLHFKLKHINLSLNEIVCGASSYLASLLDDSGMTEYLDLSNCCLPTNDEEDGLYYILYVLKNSNYLKHLNLQSNKFTKTSACTLYNVLCINQELEYLNLDQCEVPEFFLGDILKQCRALKLLDISNSIVTDEAACVLSSVISSRVLEYLNMKDCILQEDGTEILVNAMALNTNMQYKVMEEETKHAIVGVVISNLTISMYRFDVTKYDPFAVNLNFGIIKPICYYKLTLHCISEKMCSLIVSAFSTEDVEYLNISHCELSDYNFHLIMQAIQHISSLKYFVHKSSTIQDDGLNNIVTVMYNCNSNVLHVDLSDCSISGSHISCVAKGLVTVQNLRYLNISSNEMTKEAVNDVASVITCCKTLEHFHANTCGIDDVGIEIICEALSTITSLLSFDISYNQIGNNCAGQIASVLYSNAKLEYLDFTNCFTENLFTVGPIKLKSIKSLSLENNLIDNNSAEIIKTALINNIMIENLILSHCNMTEEGLLLILSTLENVHSLKYINLGSNDFTKLIAEQMFSVLHANGNLWNIDLSDCKLSQIDLVAYVNLVILSEGSVIQHINFKHNNCDVGHDDSDLHEDECVNMLPINKSLEYINLSQCKLSNLMTHRVLLTLSNCRSLTYLSLCSCSISSVLLLGSIITNNQNLEYLDLSDCKLLQEDIITVSESLRKTSSFHYLLLSYNEINDSAAQELASAISINMSLKHLSLSDCKLHEKGMLFIAEALQWVSSLQYLDLSHGVITDTVASGIAKALSCNTSLECLNMRYCTWPNNSFAIIHRKLDIEKLTSLREVDFSSSC